MRMLDVAGASGASAAAILLPDAATTRIGAARNRARRLIGIGPIGCAGLMVLLEGIRQGPGFGRGFGCLLIAAQLAQDARLQCMQRALFVGIARSERRGQMLQGLGSLAG